MKISFTPKEYARLLEIVYLAGWITGAHGTEGTSASRRYAELEQKLFALATPLGCADYVEGDPESGGLLLPSAKLEESEPVRKALDEFTNTSFWEELVARLAERDYARELAKNPLPANTTEDERQAHMANRLKQLEDRYWTEFEKNDLENIVTLFGTDRLS
jgi:hypothetical protein